MTNTERLARYTDDALRASIAAAPPVMKGAIRSARILLEVLDTPEQRVEASNRQIGIMNRLNVRASEAVRLAALQVRDGAPRFTDEYHPACPTA